MITLFVLNQLGLDLFDETVHNLFVVDVVHRSRVHTFYPCRQMHYSQKVSTMCCPTSINANVAFGKHL